MKCPTMAEEDFKGRQAMKIKELTVAICLCSCLAEYQESQLNASSVCFLINPQISVRRWIPER